MDTVHRLTPPVLTGPRHTLFGRLPRRLALLRLRPPCAGEDGHQLEVSEAARAYLAEAGYDAVVGARPLKRLIQREVRDPLALQLLYGALEPASICRTMGRAAGA